MSGDRREAIEAAIQAHLAGLIAALYSAPDAAMLTVAQVEAVSAYAARQHLALLDERDALAAKVARVSALAEEWSAPESLRHSAWRRERDVADQIRATLNGDQP